MNQQPKTGCAAFVLLMGVACACQAGGSDPRAASEAGLSKARKSLVHTLQRQGVSDKRVLAAIAKVPRHLFVPGARVSLAYANHPLAIGSGQTISQPYIVGYMTEALKLSGKEKVLEVGTGSGYQAAVLAECAGQVYSIEILPELSERAGNVLKSLGYSNVFLRVGDGFDGWPDKAPFDAIMVTAAPIAVPAPLIAQLKEGGRLSIPVGPGHHQVLRTFVKKGGKLKEIDRLPVRFVPMTGKAIHR